MDLTQWKWVSLFLLRNIYHLFVDHLFVGLVYLFVGDVYFSWITLVGYFVFEVKIEFCFDVFQGKGSLVKDWALKGRRVQCHPLFQDLVSHILNFITIQRKLGRVLKLSFGKHWLTWALKNRLAYLIYKDCKKLETILPQDFHYGNFINFWTT